MNEVLNNNCKAEQQTVPLKKSRKSQYSDCNRWDYEHKDYD